MQEFLSEAQAARQDAGAVMTAALQRLTPGSRLKFEVLRGQERLSLLAEFATPTAEQRLLLDKRARASQQLQQIAVAEQWLGANLSPDQMARVTASIVPLYREQNLLLRDIMSTGSDIDLRAKLAQAQQDRRLEALHKLIGIYQIVEERNLPICCAQDVAYQEFSSNLRRFLPVQSYFTKTLDSASRPTLAAIRTTLQFVEPYRDAHERIQEVDRRIKANDAAVTFNADVTAIQTQLQANAERGIRDPALDARIAKLPDPTRTALRDYDKQLVAAVQQRKKDAEAIEAERRKQKEAMDAGYEQLKQAKQREDERRRVEQEAAQARAQEVADAGRRREEQKEQERGKVLAKFHAAHVSSGDDLHDNPFKHQGQAVGVTDLRFKRMIEPGVAICETGTGRELLISSVPVDSFSQAGETKSLVVKVVGTQAAKNAMGGPITLTHLEYVATLP